MNPNGMLVLASAMMAGSASTHGQQPKDAVVAVKFVVNEQSAELLENAVASPLERSLIALPRALGIVSTASHGLVELEIKFDGGATDQDRKAVAMRVEELALGSEIETISRAVSLASSRLR